MVGDEKNFIFTHFSEHQSKFVSKLIAVVILRPQAWWESSVVDIFFGFSKRFYSDMSGRLIESQLLPRSIIVFNWKLEVEIQILSEVKKYDRKLNTFSLICLKRNCCRSSQSGVYLHEINFMGVIVNNEVNSENSFK